MSVTSMRAPPTRREAVPPLRDGDRMDIDEFLRRWEAMPQPRPRAELLEGVVWFHESPVNDDLHGRPHAHIAGWLGCHWLATPGVAAGIRSSLKFGRRSMPEPDDFLRILPECGGQASVVDGWLTGAPELVAEIAGSTVAKDTGVKLDIYLRHGVREYIVWRTEQCVIEWFVRRGEAFEPMEPDAEGLLKSEVFPGLWLDPAAIMNEDRARLAEVARRGTASSEHAAFVGRLAEARATRP